MELIAKSLLCRAECGILAYACIDRKDRRSGKAKEVVLLEILRNGLMHIPELTPVALIKNDNNSLIKYGMPGILFDKSRQLLNGGDNDSCIVILQLAHRLIIQVFTVNDK